MPEKFTEVLRPFAEIYARLSERIGNASDARLRELAEAVDKPTSTNCWWATKQVADIMKPMIAAEYGRRTMLQMRMLDEATKHLST